LTAAILTGTIPDLAAVLRIFLGASLIVHGYPKVNGGWRQSVQWMKGMNIPGVMAIFATIIEFFGGILLIVGLLVPVVAALVVIQFASITVMKKSKMGASYVSFEPGKATYEIDAFYLVLAAVLFFIGAGIASVDSVLGIVPLLG
jgi:putative oxidoreductase